MLKEKLKLHNPHHTSEQGITLIALVITIIVMLILVAVTINMAINGGLFTYAGNATKETNEKIASEQELANLEENMTVNQLIDKYTQGGSSEKITTSDVHNNLTTYLGKTVNYEVAYEDDSSYGEGKWEIFYADENHIYLITKGQLAMGNLSTDGYNGTADFTAENLQNKYPAVAAGLFNKTYDPTDVGNELKYSSSYNNMKATQGLLDSSKWSTYVDTNKADWAIGAPTYELFVKSYNAYYKDNPNITLSTPAEGSCGYSNPLSSSGSVPQGTYLNYSNSKSYWLACPSEDGGAGAVMYWVDAPDNKVHIYLYNIGRYCFRPVVCLKSNIVLTFDSTNNQYNLSIPTE